MDLYFIYLVFIMFILFYFMLDNQNDSIKNKLKYNELIDKINFENKINQNNDNINLDINKYVTYKISNKVSNYNQKTNNVIFIENKSKIF